MLRWGAVVLFTGVLAAQPTIELEGRYWFSNFVSTIRVDRGGVGTDIDGRNDLGFSDSNFPSGRVAVYLGHNRLSFEYTPIDFSGDQIFSRTVVFNGRTYTLGTRVISGLEVRHLDLAWTYRFRLADGRVKVGPLVEAQGFLMSGRLRAPELNIDSREDLSVGIPTVGPALEISPRRMIDVYGEASGMSAGSYGHFIRSEAGVRIRPVAHLQFTAGYRTFNLQVTNSPDFTHLHLGGPFLGARFRW
jgi:hypothetical protein